jgi:superfamily II DNA or RNA helicase
MDITNPDIIRLVGHSAFLKGQDYQRQSRVQSISCSGDTVHATVRGTGGNRYETTVEIRRTANDRRITIGTCSCPVGVNCKHVAAVLIEAKRRRLLSDDADTTGPVRASSSDPHLLPSPKGAMHAPPVPARPSVSGTLSRSTALPDPLPDAVILPPHILGWIERLGVEERGDHYPPDIAQRLIYVLAPHADDNKTPALAVFPKSIRLLKSGEFSDKASDVNPSSVMTSSPPAKYLRRSDLSILRAMAHSGLSYARPIRLDGEEGAVILADILKTDRAHWESVDGPRLTQGPAKRGRFVWQSGEAGSVVPRLELEDQASADTLVVAATPPLYVARAEGVIGSIETGISARAAKAMLDAPSLAPAQLTAIANAMRAKGGALASLAPPIPSVTAVIRDKPTPVLDLFRAEITESAYGSHGGYAWYGSVTEIGAARLSFRYGPTLISRETPGASITWLDGERLLDIRRDAKAEKAALMHLGELGLTEIERYHVTPKIAHALRFADEGDWLPFLYEGAPDLAEKGWEIRISPDFPYQLMRGDSDIEAHIREGSGLDWFELDLGMTIDGERFDLAQPLAELIGNHDPHELAGALDQPDTVLHLRLADGRYLSLPAMRLRPFIETLIQLFAGGEAKDGRMRYSALDAAHLTRLDDLEGTVWTGDENIRVLGRKLSETGHIPDVALPERFRATLRPYQARGLAWLAFLREAGLGGILADDMGLGKTVQALALIASEKAAGRLDTPALVIAPTSLMPNWRREAEKFAPDLKVLVLQGLDRKDRFDEIEGADLVLSTYPLVARDREILAARVWHILLLDEAQAIKNPNATTTRQICDLRARHRYCLTGTPVENNLAELWSLFHFIAPGFLGDARSFARDWRTPIEKKGNDVRARMLAARVRPFLLRRTKENVAPDLPAKTEMVEAVTFEPAQQAIYDTIRLAMHERVREAMAEKGLARSRIVLLDALLKLRQTCCDPRLLKGVKGVEKVGSAKLERLMEMIAELVAEGRKILIFSQFTSMLDLIRPRLDLAGIAYALLTGDTRDREQAVAAFQDGPAPVFLISLKAGGVGLNLTAADTVILYDPWWNPAVEAQAIDRAHRIGQTKSVFIFKLTALGTIEEKIEILKERKAALAASLFDPDGSTSLDITEADIDMLFGA